MVHGSDRHANRSRPASLRASGGVHLDLQLALESGGQRLPFRASRVQHPGRGVGGVVEFQIAQMRAQLLVAARFADGWPRHMVFSSLIVFTNTVPSGRCTRGGEVLPRRATACA
jgi:hypothetical protein